MSFVRFVFTIMIAGMVVNLALVLLANSLSQRHQISQINEQKARLTSTFKAADSHFRRLDLVVEAQRVGADDSVTDSTLLFRQYQSTGTDQSRPLPVERIHIPGDRVQVSGLKLEFGPEFAADNKDYQWLGGKTLVYFSRVCGASEKAPEPPASDERFLFTPRGMVPELTRIEVAADGWGPTFFEIRLWQRLWEIIPDPPPGAVYPWKSSWSERLRTTWMKPAECVLRRGHTYTAYVTTDDVVTLDEDRVPCISGLLNIMLDEGRKLPEVEAPH